MAVREKEREGAGERKREREERERESIRKRYSIRAVSFWILVLMSVIGSVQLATSFWIVVLIISPSPSLSVSLSLPRASAGRLKQLKLIINAILASIIPLLQVVCVCLCVCVCVGGGGWGGGGGGVRALYSSKRQKQSSCTYRSKTDQVQK